MILFIWAADLFISMIDISWYVFFTVSRWGIRVGVVRIEVVVDFVRNEETRKQYRGECW